MCASGGEISVDAYGNGLQPVDAHAHRLAALHRADAFGRTGEDQVAGLQREQRRQVGNDLAHRPDQVADIALLADFAIDVQNTGTTDAWNASLRDLLPKGATGVVSVRASALWLACTDKICVPENGTMATEVVVGNGPPSYRSQFDEWRRALPRPLVTPAKFEIAGDKLRVAVPLPRNVAVEEPYLFPAADGPVDYAARQHFRRLDDLLIAELPRRSGEPKAFAGVLALGDGKGLELHAVPGDVPTGGRALGETGSNAILWAVLGAIAGGLLLNLMPCVFPILALKALHLAKSGGHEREARRDALAYTLGAIIGTGALGVALLAIRAAGAEAGWAFQLQEPRTVMLLLLLATAITANLAGLFELPVLGGRMQPAGGFATGALAAFVATPCAGPFLGAALGTALLLPIEGAVLVFAALGKLRTIFANTSTNICVVSRPVCVL